MWLKEVTHESLNGPLTMLLVVSVLWDVREQQAMRPTNWTDLEIWNLIGTATSTLPINQIIAYKNLWFNSHPHHVLQVNRFIDETIQTVFFSSGLKLIARIYASMMKNEPNSPTSSSSVWHAFFYVSNKNSAELWSDLQNWDIHVVHIIALCWHRSIQTSKVFQVNRSAFLII